ncbi:MAG: penicillin-binding protein 2 [Cryomorphaceae bacterium]|nr:penicillin-binding protein 2 [Cryomorphaceae bacterium]
MSKLNNRIASRMNIMFFLFLLFSFFLIGKIFYLQNLEVDENTRSTIEAVKNIEVEPSRGNIYSDNGDLIVSTVIKYELRWDSKTPSLKVFDDYILDLSRELSLYFDKTQEYFFNYLNNARDNNNRYLLIGKNLSISDVNNIKSFPIFNRGIYKGGLIINEHYKRQSHLGKIAERTIGYEKVDELGNYMRIGLEGAYSEYLSGKSGSRLMQKIADGQWKPIRSYYEREPVQGYDVHTTIDTQIQDAVHHELLYQLEKYEADHGTMIVMETKSGKVKGISNLARTSKGKYYEKLNYGIWESQEPGSTFKLMSLIAALEDGAVSPKDSVDTGNGVLKFYNEEVKDSNKRGYGVITVSKAFEVSSNTGIVKIIYDNYKDNPERFVDRLINMKLDQKVNVDIKGEGKPKIPHPDDDDWSGISLPWMAFGYGVSMTPLQTLTFYNAVANNGEMVKPSFISSIGAFGEKPVYTIDKEVIMASICSDKTLKSVQMMLKNVVEKPWGTANNIYDKNIKIAGKTGTSQIGYTSGETEYVSSFVGYFPSDNPKYSAIVVVNKPNKSKGFYGNSVAAPVFKKVAQKIITGIPIEIEISKKDIDILF